jgi:membrane-bound lytic murein transglycosylase D
VAFWRDIYSKYSRHHIVLHHPRYVGVVYEVVDLTDIDNNPRLSDIERARQRENRVNERKAHITAILQKLAQNPPVSALSEEEINVRKLFNGVRETNAFGRAADEDGVRGQLGQRDKFVTGITSSGRYLGEIEEIFKEYGLPLALTRIIFVESMFNLHARSNVGASGIWQFMPGTGKLYLRINDLMDERNDPLVATHAAARLLRTNYEHLGSWPLAINAYNAGRGRLAQAAAQLGTNDIGRIIREFRHPSYGFASRNFFLEYLAAFEVAENAEPYLGPIPQAPPLRYERVRMASTVSLPEVARLSNVSIQTLAELNPALTDAVIDGRHALPAGFELRVPEKLGGVVLAAAEQAPGSRQGSITHIVKKGQTLPSIAADYGMLPASILKANPGMSRILHEGQTLLIPVQ